MVEPEHHVHTCYGGGRYVRPMQAVPKGQEQGGNKARQKLLPRTWLSEFYRRSGYNAPSEIHNPLSWRHDTHSTKPTATSSTCEIADWRLWGREDSIKTTAAYVAHGHGKSPRGLKSYL